jgi:hypothetical protein
MGKVKTRISSLGRTFPFTTTSSGAGGCFGMLLRASSEPLRLLLQQLRMRKQCRLRSHAGRGPENHNRSRHLNMRPCATALNGSFRKHAGVNLNAQKLETPTAKSQVKDFTV